MLHICRGADATYIDVWQTYALLQQECVMYQQCVLRADTECNMLTRISPQHSNDALIHNYLEASSFGLGLMRMSPYGSACSKLTYP